MSNHNGNANKMVSDTPRSDAEYERLFEIYRNAERFHGPLCCAFENDMRLCRQLERELAAANDRIKRLEQAGDAMANVLVWSSGTQYKRSPTASAWRKAKEAKP